MNIFEKAAFTCLMAVGFVAIAMLTINLFALIDTVLRSVK
jgi:hypothetical protein